jgi:uncharacterized protein (DUF2249 family)
MMIMDQEIYLDVCGLQAPEPMERVLEALSNMPPGDRLHMLIDREPRPLYRILDNNGFLHQTTEKPDYLYEVLIWHAP